MSIFPPFPRGEGGEHLARVDAPRREFPRRDKFEIVGGHRRALRDANDATVRDHHSVRVFRRRGADRGRRERTLTLETRVHERVVILRDGGVGDSASRRARLGRRRRPARMEDRHANTLRVRVF